MAWIESHQEVAMHPKTRKLAKKLDVYLPAAVGHLHLLWHWVLSFADDGDLSKHTDEDIAIGAMWDYDPKTFVDALVECRWLDRDGERLVVHDWQDYAGRLVDRRKANAERKRVSRARHADVPETSSSRQEVSASVTGLPNLTKPTEPNQTEPTDRARARNIEAAKWKPNSELIEWCASEFPDVDIVTETQKFMDHFAANGKPMKDWNAAWRNWMRRSRDFKVVAR